MPRSLINRESAHAGQRDKFVTIEQLTESLATSNYPKESFTDLKRVWASREYVTLDEKFSGDQLSATAMERWDIPYSVDMDPDRIDVTKARRIVFRGRVHNILAAELLPRERGASIVLTTQAKVDAS